MSNFILELLDNGGLMDELQSRVKDMNHCFALRSMVCGFWVSSHFDIKDKITELFDPYFIVDNNELNESKESKNTYFFLINTEQNSIKYSFNNLKEKGVVTEINLRNVNLDIAYVGDINGNRVYYFNDFTIAIVINKTSKSIAVFGKKIESIIKVVRIAIRDIFYLSMINKGYVELRASGYSDFKGNVNIIIGNSNAGKTTLLNFFLSNGNFNFVANGRVFLKPDDEQMFIQGTPESIAIRKGTTSILESLKPLFTSFLGSDDKKLKMSYKDLCNYFEVQVCVGGPLRDVTVVDFTKPRSFEGTNKFSKELYFYKNDVYGLDRVSDRQWVYVISHNQEKYLELVEKCRIMLMNHSVNLAFLDNDKKICIKQESN